MIDYLVLALEYGQRPVDTLLLSTQATKARDFLRVGSRIRITRRSADHYTATVGAANDRFVRHRIQHITEPELKHLGPTFEINVRRCFPWEALRAKFRRVVA